MKYKLIASDMDGTLLTDGKQITDRTLSAVRAAENAGMIFTLCTGRSYSGIKEYVEKLRPSVPLITFNGAMIVSPEGDLLYDRPMNPSYAMQIYRAAENEDTTLKVWSRGILYANRINEATMYYRSTCPDAEFHILGDEPSMKRVAEQGISKMLIIDTKERINGFLSGMCKTLGDGVRYFRSTPIYLEFVEKSVSKGSALLRLCEMLGVDPAQTVAFGDEENDRPMLRAAGLGVAMDNAVPEIKAEADAVTSSNEEDGVAEFIEYLLEMENK